MRRKVLDDVVILLATSKLEERDADWGRENYFSQVESDLQTGQPYVAESFESRGLKLVDLIVFKLSSHHLLHRVKSGFRSDATGF